MYVHIHKYTSTCTYIYVYTVPMCTGLYIDVHPFMRQKTSEGVNHVLHLRNSTVLQFYNSTNVHLYNCTLVR